MHLLKAAAGLALVVMLAGCAATVQHLKTDLAAAEAAAQTFADAKIAPNVALAAANAFDGVEALATDVLRDCTPGSGAPQLPASLCASQHGNILTMAAAIEAGRPIRNSIEPAAGQTAPVSETAYDKLQSIITTLTAAVNAFNAAKAGS